MSKTNDGGPAFPNKGDDEYTCGDDHSYDGMSLRDWFAGKALQGLLAHSTPENQPRFDKVDECFEFYAKLVYRYADAMLAERSE